MQKKVVDGTQTRVVAIGKTIHGQQTSDMGRQVRRGKIINSPGPWAFGLK